MSKKIIPINRIMTIDRHTILKLHTNVTVKFDDGVIIEDCNYKSIIMFRYFLDFIKEFNTPITSAMWIDNFLVNGCFTQRTYTGMYGVVFRNVISKQIEIEESNSLMKPLFKRMYETIDIVSRELVNHAIEYAVCVEVVDILDIQFDEDLLKSMVAAFDNPSQKTIENTYSVLQTTFMKDKYKYNPMMLFYKSGIVSIDQIRQLLAARGYLTELDSKIFAKPMTNSFMLGFRSIYDAAIESRAGTKALYLSGKAIQDSEYMSRELQLATMVLERIKIGDCGHPTYTDFFIRPKEFDEAGNVSYKGDIQNLLGKEYIHPETGEVKTITMDSKDIIGKNVKIRSGIYCGWKDKKAICTKCLGETALSIFEDQNLGHIGTVKGTSKVTQSILSTKHLLKSATSAPIRLLASVKKYLMLKNNENLFFKTGILNKKLKTVHLKIRQNEAWGLNNIGEVKDMFSININKVTRISEAILVIEGKNDKQEIPLLLKSGNRFAYLSLDALSYALKNGYDATDEEYFTIDINHFNNKKPIFVYEKVEFDFAALSKEFKTLLKTRKYKTVNNSIRSEYQPHILAQKLFELINNKLDINLTIVEIMTYPFTTQDITNGNFDLGRNSKYKDVVGFKEAINYRSIGASFDWDNLQNKVLDPMLYESNNKPSTPMDVFFKPEEVLKYEGDH